MARTRNAVKRQKVATVQSALFSPDVVFLLAGLLDARDLCQVSLTCKTLGGKQAAYSGLPLVEEAARRLLECASHWEKSCLPKYEDEGWIELYHHLLMLRSKLTFDQLVGRYNQYGEEQSTVHAISDRPMWSTALCSNHVMRSGRHFALCKLIRDGGIVGIVRPVHIDRSDFDDWGLDTFNPGISEFWEYLRDKRTVRWGDSNVHYCTVYALEYQCNFNWFDWRRQQPLAYKSIVGLQSGAPIGLLLDLDEGTLSVYQNGKRIALLKDGLSGEYCWQATAWRGSISVERSSAPDD